MGRWFFISGQDISSPQKPKGEQAKSLTESNPKAYKESHPKALKESNSMLPNGRQESKPGPGPTASPSYDPENEGAWNGQLPNPDLVDQLPPESPKPAAWPKVFDRLAWADGVVKSQRYRGATAAVFHRITTRSGTPEGCTESLRHIALGLGVTRRTVQRAVKSIRADGYIAIREKGDGATYICVPILDKGVTPLLPRGDTITPPLA